MDRRRTKAAYVVLSVLVIIALFLFACWKLVPDTQREAAFQEYQDSLAQLRSVTPMGETLTLDSEKATVVDWQGNQECLYDFSGVMQIKVLSAEMYDSRAAARLKGKSADSYADDGAAFLLLRVRIKNVNASYPEKAGWRLTTMEPKDTFGELSYEYCKNKKAISYSEETPYANLKSGQVETYLLGWSLYELPSDWELDFDWQKLTACALEVADLRNSAR